MNLRYRLWMINTFVNAVAYILPHPTPFNDRLHQGNSSPESSARSYVGSTSDFIEMNTSKGIDIQATIQHSSYATAYHDCLTLVYMILGRSPAFDRYVGLLH